MAPRRSLRLSTRVTLFFGVMALIGGIGLTFATFLFARNSLLDQRISSAKVTAIQHDVRVAVEDRVAQIRLGEDVSHEVCATCPLP